MLPFLIFTIFCAVILSGLAPQTALSDVVIAVTPTRIPLSVPAGKAQQFEITVINQGSEEANLRPEVMTVSSGENGQVQLGSDDACAWFTAQDSQLALMPSESRSFAVTISVPENAATETRHFAVSFRTDGRDQAGVGLTGGIAVLVDLDILPKEGHGNKSYWIGLVILLCSLAGSLLTVLAIITFRRHERKTRAIREGGEK